VLHHPQQQALTQAAANLQDKSRHVPGFRVTSGMHNS
jgi:hypothetical protein